jgi:hypothetical protein
MNDKEWYKRTESYAMIVGFIATFIDQALGLQTESELLIAMWGAIAVYAGSRGYLKAKQPPVEPPMGD